MNSQAVQAEWLPSDAPQSVTGSQSSPKTPKNPRVTALQPETPVVMKTASIDGANHIRSIINPFVKKDVAGYTVGVSLSTWIEAVTGFLNEQIREWSRTIHGQEWFFDPAVADALERFCDATQETGRYDPFSDMANYVIDKAKRTLENVPEEYPVSDIQFYRNDPIYLQCYEKHGALGARRKPDVLCIRENVAHNIKRGTGKSPPGAEWPSVLLFGEFKFGGRTDLQLSLEAAKTRRKFSRAARLKKKGKGGVKVEMPSQGSDTDGTVRLL